MNQKKTRPFKGVHGNFVGNVKKWEQPKHPSLGESEISHGTFSQWKTTHSRKKNEIATEEKNVQDVWPSERKTRCKTRWAIRTNFLKE